MSLHLNVVPSRYLHSPSALFTSRFTHYHSHSSRSAREAWGGARTERDEREKIERRTAWDGTVGHSSLTSSLLGPFRSFHGSFRLHSSLYLHSTSLRSVPFRRRRMEWVRNGEKPSVRWSGETNGKERHAIHLSSRFLSQSFILRSLESHASYSRSYRRLSGSSLVPRVLPSSLLTNGAEGERE